MSRHRGRKFKKVVAAAQVKDAHSDSSSAASQSKSSSAASDSKS